MVPQYKQKIGLSDDLMQFASDSPSIVISPLQKLTAISTNQQGFTSKVDDLTKKVRAYSIA